MAEMVDLSMKSDIFSIVFCMFTRPGNANSIPKKKKKHGSPWDPLRSKHQITKNQITMKFDIPMKSNTHEITMKYRLYILQNPSNPCEFSKMTTMKYPHSITMIFADLYWFVGL